MHIHFVTTCHLCLVILLIKIKRMPNHLFNLQNFVGIKEFRKSRFEPDVIARLLAKITIHLKAGGENGNTCS